MYTYPLHLKCLPDLQEFVNKLVKGEETDSLFQTTTKLPHALHTRLAEEFYQYGLNEPYNCLIFKRKNFFIPNLDAVHVDYDQEIINAAVVVPISGCNNTTMFWMDGKYRLVKKPSITGVGEYMTVVWDEEPTLVESVQIDTPMLCRVGIPHDATSRVDGQYRITMSIRIRGNPKFDDILKILS